MLSDSISYVLNEFETCHVRQGLKIEQASTAKFNSVYPLSECSYTVFVKATACGINLSQIQSNFNRSNTLGTMKISSRQR